LIPLARTLCSPEGLGNVPRADRPKRLDEFDASHFDLYEEPLHDKAAAAQAAWFRKYL
jgi:hypothetical protein